MSILNNSLLLGADAGGGGGGYTISRSLRFNSADSAYLSRTPASAGNRKTWTWAGWVKRSRFGQNMPIFGTDYNGASYFTLYFTTGSNFAIENYNASYQLRVQTTQLFRDPSAWFHLVVALDTTQGTASDRCKIYVNGSQVTALDINTYPSQNTDLLINNNQYHEISTTNSTYTFGGYLADIHFIDGQALDPTSFGEFDANGIWQPKAFSGSYGTNGFKLDFADNSNNTAATLGKDTSGNGNNWTPNNFSVTAGTGNDSLVDSPTNYGTDTGAGGEVRGNYCTLNPLDGGSATTLSNGNLDIDHPTSTTWRGVRGAIGASSGKHYFEYTFRDSGQTEVGIANSSTSLTTYPGSSSGAYIIFTNGQIANNNSFTNYGSSLTTGDVLGVAIDFDNNKIWFSKNGTYPNSGNPAAGTNAAFTSITSNTYFPVVGVYTTTSDGSINFGQRPFAYTAPSGFKALCTANLPTPTITKGSDYFDTVLYTGTGSTLTPTSSLGFSPDLVWIKGRSGATDNTLYDIVRGAEKRLESNTTDAEVTSDGGLTAFNSNGFTLGTLAQVNTNTATYAAWTWDAGSSTVTNTAGTIQSTVRANASAGFSIVTYTGNGTNNATVGHGLGVAPRFLIGMDRTGGNWQVWGADMNNGSFDCIMNLNTTAALATGITTRFRAASSTTFTIGTDADINASGNAYVTYCFAPVAGYSAFGSYTGNGSADGPFVYTGFRPRWVMTKKASATSFLAAWTIWDTSRIGYNPDNNVLYASGADAEITNPYFDVLSNGFKIRFTDNYYNESAATYIYAAFAENPFSLARAR